MRAEVLAAQPQDWRAVARACATGEVAPGRILYQKHMTHHMLPDFGLDWMDALDHAFLIRAPERVVASYAARREAVTPDDLGFDRQAELFDRVAQRAGTAPPVDRRRGGPRRSRGRAAPALRRARARLRPRHARLARRSPRERRRLGGALVRRRECLDRLRRARPRAAASRRPHARHRRSRPPRLDRTPLACPRPRDAVEASARTRQSPGPRDHPIRVSARSKPVSDTTPSCRHQHVVLDAHADVAVAVEAGLDGEDHAGLHRLHVADHHLRRLVDVEAEAVAGLGQHQVAEARGAQAVGDAAVEGVEGHRRRGDGAAELVGGAHRLVDVAMLGAGRRRRRTCG